jgi:hypothetical protein
MNSYGEMVSKMIRRAKTDMMEAVKRELKTKEVPYDEYDPVTWTTENLRTILHERFKDKSPAEINKMISVSLVKKELKRIEKRYYNIPEYTKAKFQAEARSLFDGTHLELGTSKIDFERPTDWPEFLKWKVDSSDRYSVAGLTNRAEELFLKYDLDLNLLRFFLKENPNISVVKIVRWLNSLRLVMEGIIAGKIEGLLSDEDVQSLVDALNSNVEVSIIMSKLYEEVKVVHPYESSVYREDDGTNNNG